MEAQSARDTSYATELATAVIQDGDSEIRIERLFVKASASEEIRFSWWRAGKMIPRPPDLPESQLLPLMKQAIDNGVFTPNFISELKAMLP